MKLVTLIIALILTPLAAFSTTVIDDTFTGGAGDLTGHTGDNGERWSAKEGALSLSGTGTIYCPAAATAVYFVTNKFANTNRVTITERLNVKSTLSSHVAGIWAWANAPVNPNNGYVFLADASGGGFMRLYRCNSGSFTEIGVVSRLAVDGDVVELALAPASQIVRINGTAIITAADTTVPILAYTNQYHGIWMGVASTATTGLHITEFSVVDGYTAPVGPALVPLTNAAPAIAWQSTTNARLNAQVSGGNPPFTFKWFTNATPNFATNSSNLMVGQTASNLTLSLASRMFVRSSVTDSSNQLVTSYQRLVEPAQDDLLTVARIGDSTSTVSNLWPYVVAQLQQLGGYNNYNGTNLAVGGATTANWLPGQPYMNTFTAAINSLSNRFIVSIALGVNNAQGSQPVNLYLADMTNIVNHALAVTNRLGQTAVAVFLDFPTWREPGYYNSGAGTFSENYSTVIWTYATGVLAMCNGTTVRAGNTNSLDLWAQYPNTFMVADGDAGAVGKIHPNSAGAQQMAYEVAGAIWRWLHPAAGTNVVRTVGYAF